ncbi:helix-turn-helix transcriptional regulator [Adlercreutzia sp. ZJ473]|uniref:helix-turn-helix transcriptional regulator n=1 Tax=Adlercreutzia sp. ZJ473 TaxID=2722822 RepID=UPI001555C3E4|nr:helix-turn-helix transcriptional regulator [Adlercreutzia sp. ZJ473]
MRLAESSEANTSPTARPAASGRPSPNGALAEIGAVDLIAMIGFSCYIFWELLGVFDSLPFISPYFTFEELLALKLGSFFVMTAGFFVLAFKGAPVVRNKERMLVVSSAVLAVTALSLSLIVVVAEASSFVLGIVIWCLYGLSLTLLMVAWAVYFEASYAPQTPKVIAMGYALGFFSFLLCSLSASAGSTSFFLFMGFASSSSTIGLLAFLMRDRRARCGCEDMAQAEAEAPEGSPLPWLSPLRVAQTSSFGVCYGFAITLLQFGGQHLTAFGVLGGLVGSVVLLAALRSRGIAVTSDICRITFVPVAVAMLFLPIGGELTRVICGMVIVSASIITAISSWMHAARDAARSGCDPVGLFSLTKAPGWGGFLAGVFAAGLVIVVGPQLTTAVVAVLVALVCASFALSVFQEPNRVSDGVEEKPQPETPTAFLASAQVVSICLDDIAALYGLSAREVDVLALLAKGRNAEFIADKLSIARPTAKTHIQHIYQKTAVNSQQELISLIDSELEKAGAGASVGAKASGAAC